MKGGVVAVTLAAIVTVVASLSSEAQWQEFQVKFGKKYRSLEEANDRKAIFLESLEKVTLHNAKYAKGLTTYTQGINFYSDWTWEEFSNTILMRPQPVEDKAPVDLTKSSTKAPSSADWRDIMGSVRNQRSCGSCWAFAAVGVTEGAWAKAGNGKVDLSEQMLVDCDPYGDCGGGWTDRALDTLISRGGDCSETDYPYTATNGWSCKYDANSAIASISRYDTLYVNVEGTDKLASSIAENGPHAIYLYANDNFKHYSGGIFDDPSCPTTTYNHAVIMVGYDMDEGYWLVRNSWASTWGESGHIRMKMGKNVCNCEHYAWVPYV